MLGWVRKAGERVAAPFDLRMTDTADCDDLNSLTILSAVGAGPQGEGDASNGNTMHASWPGGSRVERGVVRALFVRRPSGRETQRPTSRSVNTTEATCSQRTAPVGRPAHVVIHSIARVPRNTSKATCHARVSQPVMRMEGLAGVTPWQLEVDVEVAGPSFEP